MPPETHAPNSAASTVNQIHLPVDGDTPAFQPVFIGDFEFSLRCVYCVSLEYHAKEHHDILRQALPSTDWVEIYEKLAAECDRAFMAYHLAKSEHPEPDWAPVTDPLMKAWSEAQAGLFVLGAR